MAVGFRDDCLGQRRVRIVQRAEVGTLDRIDAHDDVGQRRAVLVAHPHVQLVAEVGLLVARPLVDTIGIVLIVIGAVLWVLGSMNHAVAGRRHYW